MYFYLRTELMLFDYTYFTYTFTFTFTFVINFTNVKNVAINHQCDSKF